jgi:Autochaperone Domain Type 1
MLQTWRAPIRDVLGSLLRPSLGKKKRPQRHKSSYPPRMRGQWKSRALCTNLLISPFALVAASSANAQTTIGPSPPTITSTVNVTPPGATVVGNTTIDVTSGDGIDNFSGGALILDTTTGPISITAPGSGMFADGSGTITGPTAGSLLEVHNTGPGNGVDAENGATLNLPGGATVTANGGVGVRIGGNDFPTGAIGNLTNVDILTTGSAIGLAATRSGTVVTMTGGSISQVGNGSDALFVDTLGIANLTNVAIHETGSGSTGPFAESTIGGDPETFPSTGGGTINITGGSITTIGNSSTGAFADGMPSIITLNGTGVTINGGDSTAYTANGGTITANSTTTLTSGASSPAGFLSNGGILTINGGSVTTTGAGSFGFLIQPVSPVPNLTPGGAGPGGPLPGTPGPNILTIESGATVNSAADAFRVQGADAKITVDGSTIKSSNGVLLNTLAGGTEPVPGSNPGFPPFTPSSTSTPGITNLTATASQLTGAITTDATSTTNLTLQGNTTWTMTGSSNLTNLVNDPSTIVFTPPVGDPTLLTSYKTLTAMNYTGMGGGITLNTFLGGDGSPSD